MSIRDVGHRLYTGEVSYDFVGRKRTWYTLSAAILLVSVAALLLRGLNFGIEFRGGAEFRLPGATCAVQEAREAVLPFTTAEPIVQQLGNGEIRVQTEVLEPGADGPIADVLATTCGLAPDLINRNIIGATWGGEVTQQAVIALVVFLLLVSVLIRVLFETKMAIAALFALAHDLVITAGLYSLVGFEVTPATVIGMLTILGYSLYDTIVVFDSLRENTRGLERRGVMTYSEAANLSVNQTLVRSINTSVIALLPIGAILFVGAFLLGAGTLKDLSLVLLVGIAASTFSSIFFATPLLADLKEREPGMQALAKRLEAQRRKAGPAPATGPAAPAPASSPAQVAVLDRDPATGPVAGPVTAAPSATDQTARPAAPKAPAPRPRPGARSGSRKVQRPK